MSDGNWKQEGASSPLSIAVTERDRRTLAMVREALQKRRVRLAYQPVVQGADPSRIAFHEGLIRILDDTGRIIPARDFMSTVETTETGRLIDCAALELGLATLAAEPGIRLSINMSARSIGYPRWKSTLQHGLAVDRTAGERLILEITEASAMLMPDLVSVFMAELQRDGISFALDDFGAGFTAFRYFKDFFFDIVKIDGGFIRGISEDTDNQVVTAALISVARHFDMLALAESVEEVADADYLRALGIDCMQGYLFGAPTTQPPWSKDARRKTA